MTNKETRERLEDWSPWQDIGDYDRFREALDLATEALVKLEKIQEIINIDNSVIQEDVMKYKMICEVIANDR